MGGTPGETEDQKKLSKQQSQLLQEQQDELDRQKLEKKNKTLDFISRLQGQSSTTAGVASAGTPNTNDTGTAESAAPFGISGLFTGSDTIG